MRVLDIVTNYANQKGISQTFICEKLGKRRNYLNNLRSQNKDPSEEQLIIIADVLGTTTAYLKGETDDPEKEKSPSDLDELLSDPLNKELFDKLAKLSAAKKQALLALIEDQESD